MERNNMSKKIRALIYVLLAFIANFILQFFVVIGMTVARLVFLKNISDDNFMVLTSVGYSIVAAVVGIVVLIVMKRMEQKKKLEYGAMGYGRQGCDQKGYDQQKDGTTECARQTCDDTYSDSRCLAYEKRYGVFKDTLKLLLFGIILQGFVYCILNLSYQVFGNTALFKNYAELISNLNGSKSLYIYIYTMFFAPISEEILFRGIVMRLAKKGGSYMFANFVQAFAFGVFHGNIIQGIYAFVLGLMLGYVAYSRNSLYKSIWLHMVVNISGIIIIPQLLNIVSAGIGVESAYILGCIVFTSAVSVWLMADMGILKKGHITM